MDGIWPALLLAWVAGFVDALGYLTLAHVFTAHMSGNAAALGAHLGKGDWQQALVRGLPLPAFVLGVAVGVVSETFARTRNWRAQLTPALVLEAVCLAIFLGCNLQSSHHAPVAGTLRFFLLVWLLAIAMGLQNATLRRAGGLRLRTTYVSGMLTNMAEEATLAMLQWRARWSRNHCPALPRENFGRRAALFGFVFLAFLLGGFCGGLGQTRCGAQALLAPLMGLLVLIIRDWLKPLHRKIPAD